MARRSISQSKKRSALIVALIAVPVLAGTAASTMQRSVRLSDEERAVRDFGRADASFETHTTERADALEAQLIVDLPGVETMQLRSASFAPCFDCHMAVAAISGDIALAAGMFVTHTGRMPSGIAEVAASEELLDAFDLRVGDTWTIENTELEVVVVGEVDRRRCCGERDLIVAPELFDLLSESELGNGLQFDPSVVQLFVRTGEGGRVRSYVGSVEGRETTNLFAYVNFRDSYYDNWYGGGAFDPESRPEQLSTVVTAAIAVEIALLAAAAFAVSTRRRIVEFGQLATVGADASHIRSLVLAEAGFLAVVGAFVGAGLGLLAAAGASGVGVLDQLSDRAAATLRWSLIDVVGPALIAVGAALVAAWLPARTVSRVPIATALAGRVPNRAVPRWTTGTGAVLLGLGMLLVIAFTRNDSRTDADGLVGVVGVLLMFGGVALFATPMLALLAKSVGKLPLVGRLAIRDSARQQARSGAAVAGMIAVVAIPVFVAGMIQEDRWDQQVENDRLVLLQTFTNNPDLPIDGVALEAQRTAVIIGVEESVDLEAVLQVPLIRAHVGGLDPNAATVAPVAQASEELLDALNAPWAVRQHLDDGGLVRLRSSSWYRGDEEPQPDVIWSPGFNLSIEYLASPLTFRALEPAPEVQSDDAAGLTVMVAAKSLTEIDHRAVQQALWEVVRPFGSTDTNVHIHATYRFPDSGTSATEYRMYVLGAAALLALIVAVVAASLAAVEVDRDIGAMVAAGAPPSLRRRMLALQTWVHLTLAAILGVPLGLLLIWAITRDGYTESDFPGGAIAFSLVVLPALVAAIVGLLFRSGQPVVSRRLS